jgi:hypothetical protein
MKKVVINLLITTIISIAFVTIPYQTAMAVSDKNFYSANDVQFYDSNAVSCDNALSTGSLSLEKSDQLQQIFQLLINGGMNSVQASAVMGNMYRESSFNSGEEEAGNKIGYGLVQWSFGRRINLEKFAQAKGVPVSDMPTQIEFLFTEYNSTYKSELSGTAFETGNDIAAATEAWMKIYEAPKMSPANDPAGLYSGRIPAAQTIYEFYDSLSPSATVATMGGCSGSGNGIVAGNIVATALNFALPQPVANGATKVSDARDTYQMAHSQYNSSTGITDCGAFVATVMIASGVDSNYANVGVSLQYNYIRNHPEKYLIINNPTVNDLQPGDILISTDTGTNGPDNEHTMIYTNKSPYPVVDASLDDRVPSVRNSGSLAWMFATKSLIIARVIK